MIDFGTVRPGTTLYVPFASYSSAGASVTLTGLAVTDIEVYKDGSTTQRASDAEADLASQLARSAGGRTISIRFDANLANDLPWTFEPRQVTDSIAVGERDLAIFEARNNAGVPITGTATFNVEPEQAGAYFNKIQCFCFTEQTLQPGQAVTMPVLFFVDPAALKDPNMDDVEQITLSYTFHRLREPAS